MPMLSHSRGLSAFALFGLASVLLSAPSHAAFPPAVPEIKFTVNKSAIDSAHRERGASPGSAGITEEIPRTPGRRDPSPAEALACSIEAMRNGGTCEACQ